MNELVGNVIATFLFTVGTLSLATIPVNAIAKGWLFDRLEK